jgi:hypothetical protein
VTARRQQLGYGALSQSAQGLAGLAQGQGARLADLVYGAGATGAGYDFNAGNTSANMMYGAGGRRADMTTALGRDQAGLVNGMTDRMSTSSRNIGNAETAGASNAINFGMALASLAAGGMGMGAGGGGGGLGGMLSSLSTAGNWRPDSAAVGGRSSAGSWMPY